jgi:azurin
MSFSRIALGALALAAAFALTPPVRAADACQLEISGNDQMQYDKPELSVAASCKEVTLTLHHTGKLPKEAMGHDWVLTVTSDLAAVAQAGMSAGAAQDYLQPGDKRVIARTKVIGGGETTSVTFSTASLKAGGDYSYECTFPGHSALMKGKFKFG